MHTGEIIRTAKIRHPQHYLEAAGQPERQGTRTMVAPTDLRFEFLMNALRLREGFPASLFRDRTGLDLESLEPELSACLAEGLLEREDGVIRCSDIGFNFLDNVLQRFLN